MRKQAFVLIEVVFAVTMCVICVISVYTLIIFSDRMTAKVRENYELQRYRRTLSAYLFYNGKCSSDKRWNTTEKKTADGYSKITIIPQNTFSGTRKNAYILWNK